MRGVSDEGVAVCGGLVMRGVAVRGWVSGKGLLFVGG